MYNTLIRNLGTEDIIGDVFEVYPCKYRVRIQINGRFIVDVYQLDKGVYSIAGDKKSKHDSRALLNQIEGVIFSHAPDNYKIRQVIDKYWKANPIKTKRIKVKKSFEKWSERHEA